MLGWMLKCLFATPLKLIASVAAAAGAFLLAILFDAIYAGEAQQVVAYLDNADADVWVMQKGVANMHMATSYLPDWKINEVSSVPGVESAEPILYLTSVVNAGGRRWFSFVVGLLPESTQAGPWAMAIGRSEPAEGEAVVPEVFAEITGIGLGDSVWITDHEFTVAGLSRGTFSMANTVIFITKVDLEDIMTSIDIVSYILVKAATGISPKELAVRIEGEVENVSALPSSQFVANDRGLVMQMGVETIAIMTAIGGALAVLLVAFTMYSQVAGQHGELAVAKALGATSGSLYMGVAVQAILITLCGVVLAAGMALLLTPVTTALLPQVTLSLTVLAVLKVALLGGIVAVIASLVTVRQVARVDPLSAFRG